MEKDVKKFFNTTNKKLEAIEKRIQEMKLNIILMSFYSDLKLIEDALFTFEAQGIQVDESLFEKIEKFKILLQKKQNLQKLGKKFVEVTEEFYKFRSKITKEESDKSKLKNYNGSKEPKPRNKLPEDFLYAYV